MWNRQHFIKDPTSGKRVARPNPFSAWVIEPVPALRIIDPALWSAAQQRLAAMRRAVTDEHYDALDDDGARPGPRNNRGARLVAARRAP